MKNKLWKEKNQNQVSEFEQLNRLKDSIYQKGTYKRNYIKKGCIKLKFIAIILAVLVMINTWIFTSPIEAQNQLFNDMKGTEWYAKDVRLLAENTNEIIKGYPDGTFKAGNKLTVDQFITMLVRAAGEKATIHSEYWAINYLNKAKQMGIIEDGNFDNYQAEINREQMAVLIMRWLAKKENVSQIDIENPQQYISDFQLVGAADQKKISMKEYKKAVKQAYKLGVLTGYDDTTFRPQAILTRAEAATVVMRMIDAGRRVAFQPEVMIARKKAEAEKYYYGSSNWVDPINTNIPKLEQAKIDYIITSGALDFSPALYIILQDNDYPNLSVDDIRAVIYYDDEYNEKVEEQLRDFEALLRRRVSQADTDKVMNHLRKKTLPTNNLNPQGCAFILKNDTYTVMVLENTDLEDVAYAVSLNILYRDEKWKELEPSYIGNAPVFR